MKNAVLMLTLDLYDPKQHESIEEVRTLMIDLDPFDVNDYKDINDFVTLAHTVNHYISNYNRLYVDTNLLPHVCANELMRMIDCERARVFFNLVF